MHRNAIAICRGPAAALAAIGLFWGIFSAWLPDVKARAEIGDGTMGLVLLGAALGNIAAMALFPRLSRRFGARLLPAAAIVLAGVTVLQLAGQGPVTVFLALTLMGMAMANLDVAANVRISMLEARHDMPLMNLGHGLYSLAFAVAAGLAGLARLSGLPQVLVVAVATGLILRSALPMRGEVISAEAEGERHARTPWAVVLPGALMLFAAFIAENATEVWSALHIERTLGAARGEGAFGPAMMGLTMAAGRFGGQAMAARLGEARLIVVSTLVGIAGALLLAFAPGRDVAVAAVALIGIGVAVVVPSANSLLGRRVRAHERPLAISRAWMLGFSGFFVGPVAMGAVAEGAGLRAGFVAVAGVMVLILVGLGWLRLRPKLPGRA